MVYSVSADLNAAMMTQIQVQAHVADFSKKKTGTRGVLLI